MALQFGRCSGWSKRCLHSFSAVALVVVLAGCGKTPGNAGQVEEATSTGPEAGVTEARIIAADEGEWLSHGRTYDEQRFSPLKQINSDNVDRLGLAWSYRLPTSRGTEATPLVFDGVLYTTGPWSLVYALDARSGELLWSYDPKVPTEWARYACCDVVNRGVAAWGNSIFVGTLDGRLVALDAKTGEQQWSVQTTDPERP